MRSVCGLLFLVWVATACTPRLKSRFLGQGDVWLRAGTQLEQKADQLVLKRFLGNQYGTWSDYVPDTNRLDHFPVRYVRINLHFMNTTDSASNYSGEEARRFAEGWLIAANKDLEENNRSWQPHNNSLPVIPTRYRLRLTAPPDDPASGGVFCHYDDELFYYIHRGKNRNLYNQQVLTKYGVQRDSVLNVFVQPHHPDSIASPTYNAGPVGVMVGGAIKIAGVYESGQPSWAYRGVLNHEVGHVFSLAHSWLNDGCPDTPYGKNPCWSKGNAPPCDTGATNNVMEYNALQNAWTPCQIGRVQQKMASESFSYRRYLDPVWCTLREDRPVVVTDTVVWKGAKDFSRHLVIAAGAQLRIDGRVSLPPNGKITLRPDATLILGPESRLHNACGEQWAGIIVEQRGREQGQVIVEGSPTIEHNRNPIPLPIPPKN